MAEHRRCANAVRSALAAIGGNDVAATLAAVAELAEQGQAALRAAVWELALTDAELLLTLAGEPDGSSLFGLTLVAGDGDAVDVDELDPPLRSAVRILLSLVNDRFADAETHLDVLCAADPDHVGIALVHLLMWTVQLVDLSAADRPLVPTGPPAGPANT